MCATKMVPQASKTNQLPLACFTTATTKARHAGRNVIKLQIIKISAQENETALVAPCRRHNRLAKFFGHSRTLVCGEGDGEVVGTEAREKANRVARRRRASFSRFSIKYTSCSSTKPGALRERVLSVMNLGEATGCSASRESVNFQCNRFLPTESRK